MKNIHELLNTEMSRQDFLKFLGVSFISIVGFGNIIAYVSKIDNRNKLVATAHTAGHGFGASKFGA